MSEFEDKINSILNDPSQMDKISNLAKSLMGGEGGQSRQSSAQSDGAGGGLGGIAELARSFMGEGEGGIDPAMLGKIGRILGSDGAQDKGKQGMLEAMKPYLSEKRRNKMDKALKIARLARIAKIAMGEAGEDGEV